MARDDEDEHFHECAQCAETEPCTALEWQALEGKGDDWFCCQECVEAFEAMEDLDRRDGRPENEDDPRIDR
jgi:hypothetical protein